MPWWLTALILLAICVAGWVLVATLVVVIQYLAGH